jgi:hypothetical protein
MGPEGREGFAGESMIGDGVSGVERTGACGGGVAGPAFVSFDTFGLQLADIKRATRRREKTTLRGAF